MGHSIQIEQYLLSDEIDFQTKLERIALGKVKLEPFSASRDVLMFRDFTSDAPSIYLFPKYSMIHSNNFRIQIHNMWKARNLLSMNVEVDQ